MKTLFFSAAMLVALFLQSFSLPTSHFECEAAFSNWDRLGKKNVSLRAEKDVINVGLYEGFFNAVKLRTKGKSIYMLDFTVHFKNGGQQKVVVNKMIRSGSYSPELQLKGSNPRVIRKVSLRYRKNTAGGTATVEVWGKHRP